MDMPNTDIPLAASGELRILVGQIRGYLASTDQTGDDAIRELWRKYVDACQQINQRLDLCAQFLERGEWIEAVRSAELEPNLLDCITALDFERRSEWEQMGCDLGWERLIPVSPIVSDRLQTAWEHRKRLKPLLKEHIRLAIARAPLAQRLAVMQRLANKDRMSTFWREDIQSLERARGPQLQRELQQAIRAEDAPRLETLLAEVRETPWTLTLPASLKKQAETAEILVLERRTLPKTAAKLHEASRNDHTALAPALLEEWDSQLSRLRGLRPRDTTSLQDLLQRIAAAVAWATSGTNRQSLISEWNSAVSRLIHAAGAEQTSLTELHAFWTEVASLYALIPRGMRDRSLQDVAEASYHQARRRRILALSVTAAMIAAAILVPGFLVVLYVIWVSA